MSSDKQFGSKNNNAVLVFTVKNPFGFGQYIVCNNVSVSVFDKW